MRRVAGLRSITLLMNFGGLVLGMEVVRRGLLEKPSDWLLVVVNLALAAEAVWRGLSHTPVEKFRSWAEFVLHLLPTQRAADALNDLDYRIRFWQGKYGKFQVLLLVAAHVFWAVGDAGLMLISRVAEIRAKWRGSGESK